jgi:hypothetical protein
VRLLRTPHIDPATIPHPPSLALLPFILVLLAIMPPLWMLLIPLAVLLLTRTPKLIPRPRQQRQPGRSPRRPAVAIPIGTRWCVTLPLMLAVRIVRRFMLRTTFMPPHP